MKKLAILILVAVSLFSMTACGGNKDINKGISIEPNDTSGAGLYANYDYENKDARDEAIYRREYVLRLSEEPEELAEFLLATNELDAFVEVDTEDHSKAIENAVAVFFDNEEIHDKALARAKEIFAETHIDCNWEAVRELDNPTPIQPPATIAETGEPISSEPAGFWLPPEDFLTEEEKEFRSQVIEAAGLDENSPDFEEQLIKLYTTTDLSEYPNYETYKLFIDRLK